MKWKNLTMPKQVVPDAGNTTGYGKFVIEPLERGFGLTLGTALRRVLLSSLAERLRNAADAGLVQPGYRLIEHPGQLLLFGVGQPAVTLNLLFNDLETVDLLLDGRRNRCLLLNRIDLRVGKADSQCIDCGI